MVFEATKIITLYISIECVQTVVEFRLKLSIEVVFIDCDCCC